MVEQTHRDHRRSTYAHRDRVNNAEIPTHAQAHAEEEGDACHENEKQRKKWRIFLLALAILCFASVFFFFLSISRSRSRFILLETISNSPIVERAAEKRGKQMGNTVIKLTDSHNFALFHSVILACAGGLGNELMR